MSPLLSGFLPPEILLPFVGALGLIFGSFVTALSYRIPRGIGVARGRSCCPSCGTALGVLDLVPVLSWLFHKGKCAHCGAKISWRYPMIELVTAVLFVVAAAVIDEAPRLLLVLALTPILVALAVIDIEFRRLPNLLLGLLALGAMALRFMGDGDFFSAAVAAVAVFAVAMVLDHIGRRFFAGAGLGMGDTKLMAIAALGLPLGLLFLGLAVAGVAGVVTGLIRRATGKKGPFPLGPAVLAALWVGMIAL